MNRENSGKSSYTPRVVDAQLQRSLSLSGAVIIEGARACGKTMTALNAAQSHVFLDSEEAQQLTIISPNLLLEGATPRLIDEWQLEPSVWNAVRREVDRRGTDGQFILTGSSVPDDDATRHTGAGRFLLVRERTMTWHERGLSTGGVSLSALFDTGSVTPSTDSLPFEDAVSNLCTSGFPAHIHRSPEDSAVVMSAYAEELTRADVRRIADIRHQPETIEALLRALARSVASEVSFTTLAKDMRSTVPDISAETVSRYVHLLERLFALEATPPWTGKLRSRASIRRSPKYNLVDPSLAAALLGATPDKLMSDPLTVGLLFESAVLHDFTVFIEALGGRAHHYRDSNGNEIDIVLTLPDGRWGAVEVKLGGNAAAPAAPKLRRVAEQLDTPEPPSFLAIVTGTGMTLPLTDGCVTFPLHALSP
ncbi:MAG TPA: DUF4143 domain-containing protein [Candidatus Corynebacterium gallistercoris]|uniref:DUF4143 domain-containing protein n=1 Tax=Candidatus Corynebacterium gallistercoris TaxID=2838530 RepID=A0A9D1RWT4_9CORY|nr:DUF4143 domain-containing protein [Candidatus Corynebacterium gallistercoris]